MEHGIKAYFETALILGRDIDECLVREYQVEFDAAVAGVNAETVEPIAVQYHGFI